MNVQTTKGNICFFQVHGMSVFREEGASRCGAPYIYIYINTIIFAVFHLTILQMQHHSLIPSAHSIAQPTARPPAMPAVCVCVSAQWLAVKMMHSRCPEVVHKHKWRKGSLECDPNFFFGASVPRGKRLPAPAPTHALIYRGPFAAFTIKKWLRDGRRGRGASLPEMLEN